MKVTLDLKQLQNEGKITQSELARLASLGREDTGSLLVNLMIGFSVMAVAGGIFLLVPSAVIIMALGAVLMAVGLALVMRGSATWSLVANICILVATLLIAAAIMLLAALSKHHLPFYAASLMVAALLAVCSIPARSGLLASLAVLALFAALGGVAAYTTGYYELMVTQPLLTVLLFSLLALGAHLTSRKLAWTWSRLLVIVARTALLLVNLGFWVGSLWGDALNWLPGATVRIPGGVFALTWAAGLIAVGVWAGRTDRRWVLNLAAVFAGIHFYTQWFDRLGATPGTVLMAGLVLLGFATFLWRVNSGRHAVR